MVIRWHVVPNAAGQVQASIASIASTLTYVIEEQGDACLAVSDGRSPITSLAALRVLPLRWADVLVTLTDERAVPPGHADSNACLVHEHLLQDAAAVARFSPFVLPPHMHGESIDVDVYVTTANDPFQRPDVVILGMGDDGYIVSLFPDTSELNSGVDHTQAPVYLPTHPGTVPHRRISLNLSAPYVTRRLPLSILRPVKHGVSDGATRGRIQHALPVSYITRQCEVLLDTC